MREFDLGINYPMLRAIFFSKSLQEKKRLNPKAKDNMVLNKNLTAFFTNVLVLEFEEISASCMLNHGYIKKTL